MPVDTSTFFSVTAEQLAALDQQKAVRLFRALLWAEAWRLRIPRGRVNVLDEINVADGGIDATVEARRFEDPSNVIFQGTTSYQIKTGSTFRPSQPAEIVAELFKEKKRKGAQKKQKTEKKTPGKSSKQVASKRQTLEELLQGRTKDDLGPSIRACLDADGTYVVVCFGKDLVAKDQLKAKANIEKCFQHCGYKAPKVEVWGTSEMVGFLKIYPSLCLDVSARSEPGFASHRSWANQGEMQRPLQLGELQEDFLKAIQEELRSDARRLIRVCGEPGIGKTRLILEATRPADLLPLIVYWDSAERFMKSKQLDELSDVEIETPYSTILIVDECSATSSGYIWDKLKHLPSRIKLITIDHDLDEATGDDLFPPKLPALSDQDIAAILQDHGNPEDVAKRFAPYCSGSPRVAHVVGKNLDLKSDNLLAPFTTMPDIWQRYIFDREEKSSESARQKTLVLTYLSLFKRFGFKDRFKLEASEIAGLIERADPQITRVRFDRILRELMDRRILQGYATLYITPKMLHIWLWTEWWRTYGEGQDIMTLVQGFHEQLFDWFAEMFRYAEASDAAKRFVADLLGERGPFADGALLKTERGAKFFLFLAEASPAKALACAERTVGTWSRDELLAFTEGRRALIFALQKIAFLKDLFVPGARLLLALAETETGRWVNQTGDTFAALFSLGPGRVAPTGASPEERFPVLQEALASSSKSRRSLGVRACASALETGLFRRLVGAEYRGLAARSEPWVPSTMAEVEAALQRVWGLLSRERRGLPDPEERQEATEVLIKSAASLLQMDSAPLAEMVMTTLEEIARDASADQKSLTEMVLRSLRIGKESLDDATVRRLEALRDHLNGSDFPSQLRRFIGLNLWHDEYGSNADAALEQRLTALAQTALDDLDLFRCELPWLLSADAKYASWLGRKMGLLDRGFSSLPIILDAQRRAGHQATVWFLSGYLHAMFETDREQWEKEIDTLATDELLKRHIAELVRDSGISDRAASRVLGLIREGKISPLELSRFRSGPAVRALAEPIFQGWIGALLASDERRSSSIALHLMDNYYCPPERPAPPSHLAMPALLHDGFFVEERQGDPTDVYHWSEVAKRLIAARPETALDLLEGVLRRWDHNGPFLAYTYDRSSSILEQIVERSPREAWQRIQPLLDNTETTRAHQIMGWLQGHDLGFSMECRGVLPKLPREPIWAWIEEDIKRRAAFVAHHVPKTLDPAAGGSLTRDLLARYGDRKDVRRALLSNFHTGGWSGRESQHYKERAEAARKWKDAEKDARVRRWLDAYLESLEHSIEEAKLREERNDWAAE